MVRHPTSRARPTVPNSTFEAKAGTLRFGKTWRDPRDAVYSGVRCLNTKARQNWCVVAALVRCGVVDRPQGSKPGWNFAFANTECRCESELAFKSEIPFSITSGLSSHGASSARHARSVHAVKGGISDRPESLGSISALRPRECLSHPDVRSYGGSGWSSLGWSIHH